MFREPEATTQTPKHQNHAADRKRPTIGFAGIADFRSIRGQELMAGLLKAVEDFDVNLINFCGAIKYSLNEDLDFISHYRKMYRYMHSMNIDGLVTWSSSLDEFLTDEQIQAIHDSLRPMPMVSLGPLTFPDVPAVITQSHDGIKLIMDHLIVHHGYRRIGFVGSMSRPQFRKRLEAYREMLDAYNLPYDPQIVFLPDHLERKDIRQIVDNLVRMPRMKEKGFLEAIITVSDIVASDLIDEFELKRIRVPEDIAIVGFNNELQSINSSAPITTVDLSFFEKGYKSVKLLLKLMGHLPSEAPPETIVLPTILVVRQSCGCFEDLITKAGGTDLAKPAANAVDKVAIQENLLRQIANHVSSSNPDMKREHIHRFSEAVYSDVTGTTSSRMLSAVREIFTGAQSHLTDQNNIWQQLITDVRRVVSVYLQDNQEAQFRMENLFHQARVMVSVFNSYINYSKKSDAYKFNALARIAISFASATDGNQVIDTIKLHLEELEMPGIYLVLHDGLLPDIGNGRLALIYPYTTDSDEISSLRIAPGRLVPKRFLPETRRYSFMMEILYFKGVYIGYALIEMGPQNVSLYDTVRTLLSHSLYAVHQREGRDEHFQDHQRLLKSEPILNILNADTRVKDQPIGHGAQTIIDYLISHLQEPSDLESMARELNMSKSHLIRKTKALTGHTVQDLHELLKVERAKILLDQRSVKVATIAERLGYQNQSYFSTVFKKVTGMSPRQWVQRVM